MTKKCSQATRKGKKNPNKAGHLTVNFMNNKKGDGNMVETLFSNFSKFELQTKQKLLFAPLEKKVWLHYCSKSSSR